MQKFRITLAIFAAIVIIVHLSVFDYSNLSWSLNKSSYIGIVSMALIMLSMFFSYRHEKQNKPKH